MRCVHCQAAPRDVSLWDQILGTEAGTVCCRLDGMELQRVRGRV